MISASVSCSLCTASLGKNGEHRRVFSESLRPVLPLLSHIVTKIYRWEVLQDMFTTEGKLCHPCHRCLKRITKLKKELQEKEEELTQQVRRLGELCACYRDRAGTSVVTEELTCTPWKRPSSTVEGEDSPATKRRAMLFQKVHACKEHPPPYTTYSWSEETVSSCGYNSLLYVYVCYRLACNSVLILSHQELSTFIAGFGEGNAFTCSSNISILRLLQGVLDYVSGPQLLGRQRETARFEGLFYN